MSNGTAIEWTRGDDGAKGASWNPVTGCDAVSPGCDLCYAEAFAERWRGIPGHPYEQGFDVRLWPERLNVPMTWRRPRRIFVNSMSDLFHGLVPDGFIGSVWNTMALTPWHTYIVLTKRPARMRALLSRWEAEGWSWRDKDMRWCGPVSGPLPNVWIGVSVEDQRRAELRMERLVETPAAVRFASCEPLHGWLELDKWLRRLGRGWVILGGESGHKARPMHPDWARSLRDQCVDAGVPFFFKQWGQWAEEASVTWRDRHGAIGGKLAIVDRRGKDWSATPAEAPGDAVRMRRVGKGRAGRVLDGRRWDEFPVTATAAAYASELPATGDGEQLPTQGREEAAVGQ
jgi:protein gp37